MNRKVKLFLSMLIASVMLSSVCSSNTRVMALDDGYLDFSQITNKQLPFNYNNIAAIGGGSGYDSIVTSGTANISAYDVNNILKTPSQLYNELIDKISQANNGDTIFIDSLCVIEFPATIEINKAITIASNRGYNTSDGALLEAGSTLTDSNYVFNIKSNNVRITGFRFRGNKDSNLTARAIKAYDHLDTNGIDVPITNIEIDNCDFSYWIDAIDVQERSDTSVLLTQAAFKIHHNYIHQNNLPNAYSDLGYGVMVDNAYAQIYANIFHNNRHDIAAAGHDKSGYEAYCNIILGGDSTQSNFDMHGDRILNPDGTYTTEYHAGGFMHIHHNDFRNINPQANIYPVGKPKTICLIDNNKFCADSIFSNSGSTAIRQDAWGRTNSPDAYGNIVAVNNIYGSSNYLGWYARENWDKTRTDNFFRIPSTNDLLMADVSATLYVDWINTNQQDLDYYLGDFNGDGITDIFKSDGNIWYYLPINIQYTDHWIQINNSDYKIGTMSLLLWNDVYKYSPNLTFGNFDTNNSTDILLTTGSQWNVSYGASTAWQYYVSSSETVDKLLFGKFYRSGFDNNITDVFFPYNNSWYISYDGTGWQNVNSASDPYSQMKIGDFNGDGYSDVFCATGSQWKYSSNATSTWINLKTSAIDADSIVLGDFNADNTSDVICLYDNSWWVSIGGNSSLSTINTSNFPLSNFIYGNLD